MAKPEQSGKSDFPHRMVAQVINTQVQIDSETSRIRAALVNSGRYSFVEAEEKILDSRLHVEVGVHASRTPAGQSAFLTAVLTGARCFGEVTFGGHVNQCLLRPLPIPAKTLAEAAAFFDGRLAEGASHGRTLMIGDGLRSVKDWSMQASWDG